MPSLCLVDARERQSGRYAGTAMTSGVVSRRRVAAAARRLVSGDIHGDGCAVRHDGKCPEEAACVVPDYERAGAGRAYLRCAVDAKIVKRPADSPDLPGTLQRCISAHHCGLFNVRRLQPATNHGPCAPHSVRSVKAFRDGCWANDVWPINLACRDAGRRLGGVLSCAILARCSRYPPSSTPSDEL